MICKDCAADECEKCRGCTCQHEGTGVPYRFVQQRHDEDVMGRTPIVVESEETTE